MGYWSKSTHDVIEVELRDGLPYLVNCSGRTYWVRGVLKQWSQTGYRWIVPERRDYYLLESDAGQLEVYTNGSAWRLSSLIPDDYEGEVLSLDCGAAMSRTGGMASLGGL